MIERRKALQNAINTPLRLYTLQELAQIFHVPLATVRFWRSMRRFPVVKVGRQALVDHRDLLALVIAFKQPGGLPTQPLKTDPEQGSMNELGASGGPNGQA